MKKDFNETENVQQQAGQVNNQARTVADIVGEDVNQMTAEEQERE